MSRSTRHRLELGALLVAIAASFVALSPPGGSVAEGLDCRVAARVIVGAESRLLCGGDVVAEGAREGERIVDGQRVGRMSPAEIGLLGLHVDVNAASEAELDTLPRIGPVLARRIIEGRPYARLDDLLEVQGIGPKTLEGLLQRATLELSPVPSR